MAPSSPAADDDLVVLLLSDGIAGHYRQSEAVVMALARRRGVRVVRIELPRQPRMVAAAIAVAARLAPTLVPAGWLTGGPTLPGRADLVVSAGGRTLAANVLLARRLGAANVFCGSPRRFPITAFDRIFTPEPVAGAGGRAEVRLKPVPVDPDRLPPPQPFRPAPGERRRLGVLVGGPTPHADFTAADWGALVAALGSLARIIPFDLTLVTSRRTPASFHAALAAAPIAGDGHEVVDFRADGPGSIGRAFAADALLVTGDSMTMIAEAVATRRPVLVVMPARTRPSRDDHAVAALVADGRIAVLPIGALTPERVQPVLEKLTPMTENHLETLADSVMAILPADKAVRA